MFTIEKGIPCPALQPRGVTSKYPFDKMEVGDSFFVPVSPKEGEAVEHALSRLRSNIEGNKRRVVKMTGHTITVRIVEGGVRVWRTA